jgi:hypothetical protein
MDLTLDSNNSRFLAVTSQLNAFKFSIIIVELKSRLY